MENLLTKLTELIELYERAIAQEKEIAELVEKSEKLTTDISVLLVEIKLAFLEIKEKCGEMRRGETNGNTR